MKKIVAIFDIDGTIIHPNSSNIFYNYLIAHGEIRLKNHLNYIKFFFKNSLKDIIIATKGNFHYLKGKEYSHLCKLGQNCFKEKIVSEILPNAIKKIEEHRRLGHELVLLSGTTDILLKEFQKYLRIEKAFGSVLETKDGIVTGNIASIFAYGKNKPEIIKKNFGPDTYEFKESYTYANSESDFSLFELFGHPVLVNPKTRKLISLARKRNIVIEYFIIFVLLLPFFLL